MSVTDDAEGSQVVKGEAGAGVLSDIIDGIASGWAWDPTNPDRAVEVEIFAEGFCLGRGSADLRMDSKTTAGVTGAHAFNIAIVPPKQLSPPYEIWAQLAGTEISLQNNLSIESMEQHERFVVPFAGEVTGISAGALEGWAVRKAFPTIPLKVELSVENETIIAADAGNSEPASPAFGLGHGFRLKIPEYLLNGSIHVSRVRVSGSNFEIKGSPFPFAFLPISVISDRLDRLEGITAELRRDRDVQFTAIEKLYADVGRDLAQRLDAMMSLQRVSFEAELSSLREAISDEREGGIDRGITEQRPSEMVLDENYVGYGWYGAETDDKGRPFRWMKDKSAVVLDYQSKGPALLTIEGWQILDAPNIDLVKVRVNGVPLSGTASVLEDGWSYVGTVPAHALRGSPFAVISFEADFARRPRVEEERLLSISVRAVRLSPPGPAS